MIFHVLGDLHMAFSLEQHNETHPKPQSFQEVQIQISQLETYFYLALLSNPFFFFLWWFSLLLWTNEIRGSTVQPRIATPHPGSAVHPVHTPITYWEETRGDMSSPTGQAAMLRCNASSYLDDKGTITALTLHPRHQHYGENHCCGGHHST